MSIRLVRVGGIMLFAALSAGCCRWCEKWCCPPTSSYAAPAQVCYPVVCQPVCCQPTQPAANWQGQQAVFTPAPAPAPGTRP